MKIYVVLETIAANDGVVTKALKAFKTDKAAEKYIDERDINEGVKTPSVTYVDYQEIELEDEL